VIETVHILIDDRSQSSSITCPYCDRETTVPNAQFFKGDQSFRVTCLCHNVFTLITNRRRFQRHQVNVTGDLMLCTSHKKLATIHITSLSVDGIGFHSQPLKPQVGDTFTVAFTLDDAAGTVIVDDIVICNITDHLIGAKFLARNGYNPDVDLYLMAEGDTNNNP